MGLTASNLTFSSTCTSGNSFFNAKYTFFKLFNFINSQSLHPQVESDGGAGINILEGEDFCILCKIPASVATINMLASFSIVYFNKAAVLPTKSAKINKGFLHSGWQ